jgi:hypothetical protein
VDKLLEAAVAADGLVKFLVDCFGRVVAARLRAGRRRNIVNCTVYCITALSFESSYWYLLVDLLIGVDN